MTEWEFETSLTPPLNCELRQQRPKYKRNKDDNQAGAGVMRGHMIQSRSSIKWETSSISFVKMSAKFILPSIWQIFTKFDATFSRTRFSFIWMWRNLFVVLRFDQLTHAWLSLNITLVLGINIWWIPKKVKIWVNSRRNLTHSSVAYISASSELPAVTD